MILAATPLAAPPPNDPVKAALDDSEVRTGLLDHARAVLGRRLAGRPAAIRSDASAEAVQETQLRALQKRHEYNPAVGAVRGWLHGILNKVLSETIRSICVLPAQAAADHAAWERLGTDLRPGAAQSVPNWLAGDDYLMRLPAKHRQILQLRYYEDLSHREIGARLGISPNAARVRLCRALAAVKIIAGVGAGEDRR